MWLHTKNFILKKHIFQHISDPYFPQSRRVKLAVRRPNVARTMILCGARSIWRTDMQCGPILLFITSNIFFCRFSCIFIIEDYILFYKYDHRRLKRVSTVFSVTIYWSQMYMYLHTTGIIFLTCVKVTRTVRYNWVFPCPPFYKLYD
jgi:hypothetical protein